MHPRHVTEHHCLLFHIRHHACGSTSFPGKNVQGPPVGSPPLPWYQEQFEQVAPA